MFYLALEKIKKYNPYLVFFHFFVILFTFIPFLILALKAVSVEQGSSFIDNTAFVHIGLLFSLIRSFWVATWTLLIVMVIGYPFAYLVANLKSSIFKVLIVSLVTAPLWSSFFVKLVGLKSFFDLVYGDVNSTRGLAYVIIGLVYIYLPIAILNFYNIISSIPKNIINASLDLGSSRLESAIKIVIPYTKKSIVAVFFLVFLPAVTSISVADFLNCEQGSKLIAQNIHSLVQSGNTGSISNNRLSFVTLFIAYVMFVIFCCFYGFKSIFVKIKRDLHRRFGRFSIHG
ncbi:ABC transporter permease [Candidatus Mycoplasma haematohominis]|uniref:ABC transporter permease n=1 Tax=Candidatus Mycoplasma haematohominis TaxID=1494318 RepID=UPI001C0A7195|nr:ABC transporter permease subunit [Candidatus Mycoplasma haemohominis]